VRTLTNSPGRANPFGGRVEAHPYHSGHPDRLADSLRGASVLYSTYWVRFNRPEFTFASAIENSRTLFRAAKQAGVSRVVHISITNPSEDSPLEYFRGKALVERALIESGLSYAILRPAVLFGKEDILINNIAWFLRSFPVFGVFGDGSYRLRPIYVDDLAALALERVKSTGNSIIDAVGPETFTFRSLVEQIGEIIGARKPIISLPPTLGYLVGWLVGKLVGDVIITRDEIAGLMAGLLDTDSPATGATRFSDWARENAASLGARYARELTRRTNRLQSYESL